MLIIPLFVIGLFFHIFKYPDINIGYYLLVISVMLLVIQILNKLLNIPLEYNASRRALKYLKENNFLSTSEYHKAKKLLSIAAQTYIASLFDELIPRKKKKTKRKKR
jgi:Zn-dependent membrane protease YugP